MTPAEAAKLLELPADATPDQIEARFNELRAKLEDKIAKAPTPGLKAKYRETLDEITAAFETLTLAADSSALPVLNKQSAVSDQRSARTGSGAGAAATPPRGAESENRKSRIENRKSGKEFIIVAVIAVAVLGAGGWWVMKTRAEKAEQARIAAETRAAAEAKAAAEKIEAEQKAEEARLAAEAKRKAEEEEKARLAAAAKAEQERLDKLQAQTSAELVDLRIAWDAVETERRKIERRLAELRSEEKELARGGNGPDLMRLRAEVNAYVSYYDWLEAQLGRHDAKVLRAKAEAMVSARQPDEAARIVAQAANAQSALDREIASTRSQLLTLTGPLRVDLKPAEVEWTLTDAYGVKRSGRGAADIEALPWGPVVLEASLPGYRSKRLEAVLSRGKTAVLAHEFKPAIVRVDSVPQGAAVSFGGKSLGTTPATLEWPGDGEQSITLTLRAHRPFTRTLSLSSGETVDLGTVALEAHQRGIARPAFDRGPLRYEVTRKYESQSRSSNAGIDSASSTNMDFWHRVEVESPTESSADATRVRIITLRNQLDGRPVMTAGTIQDYSKVKEGWLMTFALGGFVDPAMRAYQKSAVYKASPVWRRVTVDNAEWWPHEEKFPGDSWEVPLAAFKDSAVVSVWDREQKGTVSGKVLALTREDGRDVAEVEFTFDVSSAFVTNDATQRSQATGRIVCTVDLTRNYVLAERHTIEETSTMELKSSPDYKGVTKTTGTTSVSVRPL